MTRDAGLGGVVEATRRTLLGLAGGDPGTGAAVSGPAFLAASLGTELAKFTGAERLEHLCKPLIAPAALAYALRRGAPGPVDTALLALAGAGYTAGDVVLMLGGGHAERGNARLARGSAAFAVGHVALAAVLLRSGLRPRPAHLAVQALPAGVVATRLARKREPGSPVLAGYAVLLSALSGLTTSAAQAPARGDSAAVAAGGPVFQLSDLLILVRRAATPGSLASRLLDVAVIDTYALATLLLLCGAADAAREG